MIPRGDSRALAIEILMGDSVLVLSEKPEFQHQLGFLLISLFGVSIRSVYFMPGQKTDEFVHQLTSPVKKLPKKFVLGDLKKPT